MEELPEARLSGPERQIALLLDHREDLVEERTRIQQRLCWLLRDIDPEIEIRGRSLHQPSTLARLSRRLRRTRPSTQARIWELGRCSVLSQRASQLERESRYGVSRGRI